MIRCGNHSLIAKGFPPRRRTGAISLLTLVCLIVGTSVLLTSLRGVIAHRRRASLEHQLTQTEWLLEAGIARAVAGLRDSSNYGGETWLPADSLAGFPTPVVIIEVRQDEPSAANRRIRVQASLGVDPSDRTVRSDEFEFTSLQSRSPSLDTAS